MKHILKRTISILLVACMLLGLIPQLQSHTHAASNIVGTFEGQAADVFSALGFDTSVMPEGYDAETTDNPYGRDKLPGNQIFELHIATDDGSKTIGTDDNTRTLADTGGLPTTGAALPLDLFAVAAGDFDGDGLAGEAVYVGFKEDEIHWSEYTGFDPTNMYLLVYDGKTGTYSDLKTLSAVTPLTVAPAITEYAYAWQNLLQVTAGDWDGDGTSEIAVYVAENGVNRVDIYKYQKTSQSPQDGWLEMGAWARVWSHAVNSVSNKTFNMVSLVSADLNRDGVDDLGISAGRYSAVENRNGQYTDKSSAVILWGARSDMLQTSSPLDLNEDELGDLARVSLTTGDLDGDGYKELIATGHPISDLSYFLIESGSTVPAGPDGNTTRTITTYIYDQEKGLVVNYSGTHKPRDGQFVTSQNGDTAWQSANGFDEFYYSVPVMRTNAAVVRLEGHDYPFLYLDSCLYEFTEGQGALKMALDDEAYDGENTMELIHNDLSRNDYPKSWGIVEVNGDLIYTQYYAEYGAVSGDINGTGYDLLATSLHSVDSRGISPGTAYHNNVLSTLGGSSDGRLQYTYSTEHTGQTYTNLGCAAAVMLDTDIDTTLIEYTGEHYLTYTDPKVLAVIAAAPYFEDVDEVAGYDYAWQNTTSYSTVNGEGEGKHKAVDLEIGNWFEATVGLAGNQAQVGVAALFTLEWMEGDLTTKEYTLSFETSQDEDAIAFFSIPVENYVYRIYTPDGKGDYAVTEEIISRQFTPCYQVLNLEYYESIRGNYKTLPAVSGAAITSTPGDPSSYPSSTSGYDVIVEWNNSPAGVSFGNGAITQEITVTEEHTNEFNLGAAVDFQAGGGSGFQSDILQAKGEAMGGFQFSMNPTGGWTKINLEGTVFSGTVTNMPLEFQDYGYYYNWKLFAYNYTFKDGNGKENSVPVVSYIVGDVSEPPALPEDFQQDFDRTTSDKNVLTWTYDAPFTKFHIYKYYDFPVGGGFQEIAVIPSDTVDYTVKYDENGKVYKEYYFEDENLAAYTEYQYAIQVERLTPVPPLSSPSAVYTARTKASVGYPSIVIQESDNENDGELRVYGDKNAYVTAQVTGPKGEDPASYYTTVQYQWQKMEKGAWTDMVGETNRTLSLVGAGVETTGTYRCRINLLTKADATAITAYTDSINLTHAFRGSYIEEVYVHDVSGGGVELFASVRNAHADSAAIPDGTVTFTLTNNATGREYFHFMELNSAGVCSVILEDSLPEGMYSVEAYYSGSKIFKASSAETLYLSQRSSGHDIDVPNHYEYGNSAQVIFREVDKTGGITTAVEVPATGGYALMKGEKLSANAISGATTVSSGSSVTRNQAYRIQDEGMAYYFIASHSGTISLEDQYVIYDAGTDITSTYMRFTNDGGKYDLAENLPAGGYVLRMAGSDGVNHYASFTVDRRALTLQLPTQKGEEGTTAGDEPTDAPSIPFGSVPVVSGSWAPCDMPDGVLKSEIADPGIYLDYINTAGKIFSRWSVDAICGFYTIRAQVESNNARDILANYDVDYLDGSITILGATRAVSIGARPFEGQQVGTLHAVAPEYGSTRTDLSDEEVLILNHATGTRMVFTAVPDEGYEIYDWYINGVSQGSKATSLAYVLLAEDTTVEVQFVIKQNNLIFGTAGDAGGGTIVCDDPDLTSDSSVLANSHFFFTAKANPGYHFKEWRYTEEGKGTIYDDTDNGLMESTFELLMPAANCSVYAVFERDFYTFSYTDGNGADGLTAWYYGSLTGDATAGTEKITIVSGQKVKGDTVITVEPRAGYALDDSFAYGSVGSQGTADYDNGTYTLTLTEDTEVTGYTVQQAFDLTLTFDVETLDVFPEGTVLTYNIGSEQYTFPYTAETPSITIPDVPGGTQISATVDYPGYYDLTGIRDNASRLTAWTPATGKEPDPSAVRVEPGDPVEKGRSYFYEVVDGSSFQPTVYTYFFTAHMDGIFGGWHSSSVRYAAYIHHTGPTYELEALSRDETVTVFMKEKPTHHVTMADITGKGTYGVELPEGAYETVGSDNRTVVTLHEGDTFTALVTPEQKWTVSYWEVTTEAGETTRTRATSLKYAIPDVTQNFTFTPIFSSTTYNTISWPSIDEDLNGLTLSPLSGYLYRVAAGGEFKFKLSGSTLGLLNQVYVNGEPFVPEGEQAGDYTYTGDGADRVYTIANIQENKVITLDMVPLGVTVNGTDIIAMSGTGWVYDHNTQVLTLNRSNLVVSGRTTTYAPNLSIVTGPEALSVVLDNLTMDPFSGSSSTRTAMQIQADAFTITAKGDSFLEGQIRARDLIVRGNGSLEVENDGDHALEATNLNLLGDVTLELMAVTYEYSLRLSGSLNVGAMNSTAAPTFRSTRGSISVHTINTHDGMLTVHSRIAHAVYAYDVNNYGGVMDLTAPSSKEAIWLEDGNGWRVYYPSGFLVTETTAAGATSTYYKQPNGYSAPFEYDVMGEYKNAGSNKNPSVIVQPLGNSSLPATVQIGRPSDGANVVYDMSNLFYDLHHNETQYEEAYICLAADPFVIRPVVLLPGAAYSETEYQRYKDMGLKAAVYCWSQGGTQAGTMSAAPRNVTWESLGDGTWTPSFSYDTASSYDYTLSGVWGQSAFGIGLTIGHIFFENPAEVNSLTLSNMTMLNGSIESSLSYISVRGDNVLYNTDPSYGRPLVTYLNTEIQGDGESTLTLVGYDDSEPMLSVSSLILKDMESVTALNTGAGGAMGVSELYMTDSSVQEYSDLFGGLGDKTVPYNYGWKQDVGANANQARTQSQPMLSVTNKYTRIYSNSCDAIDRYTYFWYDLDLDTFQMSTRIYEPVDNGRTRALERVTVIDSEGNETPLVLGDATDYWNIDTAATDLIWSGRNYMTYDIGSQTPNLYAYESSGLGMPTFKSLEPGWYTIRVYFQDPDPSDATFYYLDMPLEIRRSQTSSNTLSVSPVASAVGRNQSVSFTTSYIDDKPSRYAWFVDGTAVDGATGSAYTYTVPADAEIGSQIQIIVRSYLGDEELGFATATVTVTPSAADIAVTTNDATPAADGSYTLSHVSADGTARSWDFEAAVTMDDGSEADLSRLSWSLWGNVRRTTTVDSTTGVLTIDPRETTMNGALHLIATYKNSDGTELKKTTVIYLSTDALVSWDDTEAEFGVITGATAGEITIQPGGTYVPGYSLVTVQAQPTGGNIVTNWLVNGQSVMQDENYTVDVENSTLSFLAEEMTVYAVSAQFGVDDRVRITYLGGGDLGTLTATVDGEAIASGDWVNQGDSVTFTATPNDFCYVHSWYVNGELVEGHTENTLTLLDLTERQYDVAVEFVAMERTVSVAILGGGGSVEASLEDYTLTPDETVNETLTDATLDGEAFAPGTIPFQRYTLEARDALKLLATTLEGGKVKSWAIGIDKVFTTVQTGNVDTYTLAPGTDDITILVFVEDPAHVHTYIPVVTEPTCTTMGYTTYSCACGDSYKADYTDPTGHDYASQITPPTCTKMGYTTHTCTCGDSYVDSYTDPTGHSYTKTVTMPTCISMGYTTYTCECGDTYIADYVDVIDHSYTAVVTEPTCTEGGYTTYTCTTEGCGNSYVADPLPAKGHSYTAQVVEPTCTAMGYTIYTCECGDSYKADYVAPTGHTFGDWTVVTEPGCGTKGQEQRSCQCGETEYRDIEATDHQYVSEVTPPTCTKMGYTTHTCACGDSYVDSYTDPTGHTFGDWTVETEPGCGTKGQEQRSCECGETEYRDIEATGHQYVPVVTPPTCTKMGYTTHTCTCGDSYVDSYTDPTGHTFGDWTVVTEPGCGTKGQEKRSCQCGETEYRDIEATGHQYVPVVTPPTCTKMGYTTHTCACGDSYVDSYTDPTGHSFGDWTVVTEPGCGTKGQEKRSCQCGETEYRDIEATGHQYVPVVTPPTCTKMGYTTHTCSCGDSYVDSYTDPTGHTFGDWTVVTEPGCGTKGQEQRSCECGETEYRDIEATGHSFTDQVTEPTHDRMGYTTHTCHCGYSYVDSYTDALDHDYTQTVTREPTCTEEGIMTFTCECGETYTQPIARVEHSYTAEVTAPTCDTMGYTTYTCACGDSYVGDYVDATGHELEQTVVDPTCLEEGHTTLRCKHCDYSSVTNITAPTGHAEILVGQVEATYTHDGYTGDLVCETCDRLLEKGQVIPKLIAPDSDYEDVPEDAWYEDAVDYVTHIDLMKGVGDGKFAPNANGTRAMIVTMLYRLAGEPSVEGLENPFRDVSADAWYYDAVIWGSSEGVIKGISETEFAPNRVVTREQLVTMLHRYVGSPEGDLTVLDDFPDGDQVSSYARPAMAWAIELGIISGYLAQDQLLLNPQQTATRAQIATIFMRYLEG